MPVGTKSDGCSTQARPGQNGKATARGDYKPRPHALRPQAAPFQKAASGVLRQQPQGSLVCTAGPSLRSPGLSEEDPP